MRNKRGGSSGKKEEGGLPEWMATYGDMVTLLLTFFIMLFSMATIDKQKYVIIANALKSQFMVDVDSGLPDAGIATPVGPDNDIWLPDRTPVATPSSTNMAVSASPSSSPSATVSPDFNAFVDEMEQLILDYDLGEYVTIIDEATTITLRIESIVLFDSGSADIKQVGRDVLKRTGEMLKTLNRDIEVQGHTDSVPIKSALFPTNWELSTKRATNVVLFLVQNSGMDPKRLTATGNGEYRPIVPNDTDAHRQKNRRIDIFIEK